MEDITALQYDDVRELVNESEFITTSPSYFEVYYNKRLDLTIKIKDYKAIIYYNRILDFDNLPCRFKDEIEILNTRYGN